MINIQDSTGKKKKKKVRRKRIFKYKYLSQIKLFLKYAVGIRYNTSE